MACRRKDEILLAVFEMKSMGALRASSTDGKSIVVVIGIASIDAKRSAWTLIQT